MLSVYVVGMHVGIFFFWDSIRLHSVLQACRWLRWVLPLFVEVCMWACIFMGFVTRDGNMFRAQGACRGMSARKVCGDPRWLGCCYLFLTPWIDVCWIQVQTLSFRSGMGQLGVHTCLSFFFLCV